MNNHSFLSPRMMVGAAIVGLVGAAGMFIYEQVYAEKRRSMLVREVARLDQQVSSMKSELDALKELQKEVNLRRQKQKTRRQERAKTIQAAGDTVDGPEQSYQSDSEYYTDYQSVLGTDGEMDSEEFYDVHTDSSDDTLREPSQNGHIPNIGPEDDLLDQDAQNRSPSKPST